MGSDDIVISYYQQDHSAPAEYPMACVWKEEQLCGIESHGDVFWHYL